MSKGKKTAGKTSSGQVKTTTAPSAQGTVLPVTDKVDLSYLCHKIFSARVKHNLSASKQRMMQRQVSWWIRQDASNMDYQFLYCGEVGFDMTAKPTPVPIMSKKMPFRPSVMPVSLYRQIYQDYVEKNAHYFNFVSFELAEPVATLDELEALLDIAKLRMMQGERVSVEMPGGIVPKSIKGAIRIPDVIRKKNPALTGAAGFHPDNIETVIEIKFDETGDRLDFVQERAYIKIAGARKKLRVLTSSQCDRRKRQRREAELAAAKADPVYGYVGDAAMSNPTDAKYVRALEQQVQFDYNMVKHEVERWAEKMRHRPQQLLLPPQDLRAQQRAQAGVEMSLVMPHLGIGAVGMAVTLLPTATVTTVTTVATESAVIQLATPAAGQVLQFPVRMVAGSAVTTALPLAAQDRLREQPDQNLYGFSSTYEWINQPLQARFERELESGGTFIRYYVYWPD